MVLDARVAADPELAQTARARIGVEHAEQELLVRRGARVDDLPALEAEADVADLVAQIARGVLRVADDALGRVLDGGVENLAAGHVRPERVHEPVTTREAEPEVRPAPTIRTSSAASKRSAIRRIATASSSQSTSSAPQ